jgi:hypothetical protein
VARYQFSRAAGPWDYPALGLGAVVTGDVIETAARPDAYWTEVDGSTPVTRTPDTGYTPSEWVEVPEGSYYAYDSESRQFVLTAPPSATYGGVTEIP